jgi:hypothetical protein
MHTRDTLNRAVMHKLTLLIHHWMLLLRKEPYWLFPGRASCSSSAVPCDLQTERRPRILVVVVVVARKRKRSLQTTQDRD